MSEVNQNQSKFLYIAIGILVPIFAALIPYAYKYVFPEHDLNYRLISTTEVKSFKSLSLELVNNGENVEKNVLALIKKSERYSNEEYKFEDNFLVEIDPKVNYKLTVTDDFFVINLGNLRPREKLQISIMSPDISYFTDWSLTHDGNVIIIKSDDNLARFITPSDFLEFVYPISFWILMIIMSFGIVGGIYIDFFLSKEKKKERFNIQIESIKKQIDKLDN